MKTRMFVVWIAVLGFSVGLNAVPEDGLPKGCDKVQLSWTESLVANIQLTGIYLGFKAPIANSIRDKYNACISFLSKEVFEDLKEVHRNKQSATEDFAKRISDKRNNIKEYYQGVTPFFGWIRIYARNLMSYGQGNPTFESLMKHERSKVGGKTPEEITYSSLKTGGKDLGLSSNDIGIILDAYKDIKAFVGDPSETGYYPEAMSVEEAKCFLDRFKSSRTKENAITVIAICGIESLYP